MEFMDEEVVLYYPNSICFEDKKQLELHGNWFDKEFNNFYISVEACSNSTYEGPGACKDNHEIYNFMSDNPFYVVSQKTIADIDIYQKDSDPKFNIDGKYFPLKNRVN